VENDVQKYVQIALDADLKKEIKIRCAAEGKTLRELVTKLLTDYLNKMKI
jgi:hypothetical protein